MKINSLKPLWITLIVVVSLILLAVAVGVLNATVGNGEWQIGWQFYRYEAEDPNIGGGTVYSTEIKSLDIDWIRGDVEVVISEDDRYLSITENSEDELAESAQLRWWVDADGTLMVRSRDSGGYLASSMPKKKLTVRVPKDMMLSLSQAEISAPLGNVQLQLTEDMHFTVLFDSQSGQLLSDFSLRESNGEHSYGDGTMQINVETKKGSLFLKQS